MRIDLSTGWSVLQDVHDVGERLGVPDGTSVHTTVGSQLSEWEPIPRLEHLQVLFEAEPYWGRRLRYFNTAPWWYRRELDLGDLAGSFTARLRLSNADYFAKVWVNGVLVAEQEGYACPVEVDVTDALRPGERNLVVVKVWSPWDTVIRGDDATMRTFNVERDMIKGTYEHDDTLIARDVNPVGIYGEAVLDIEHGPAFDGGAQVDYRVTSVDDAVLELTVAGTVTGATGAVDIEVRDCDTGEIVAAARTAVADRRFRAELVLAGVRWWDTWDHGDQSRYELTLRCDGGAIQRQRIGFRRVELDRTETSTAYRLNGRPFYVRGASYFPDVYISTMTRERYLRDLLAIRAAGFNLVRVHVHVQREIFYDLCDELGIAVMQDSDYNWVHPDTEEWATRLVRIAVDVVTMLRHHPSIITWIALNEPDVMAQPQGTGSRAMQISPGPQLYRALTTADPTRPVIKGSFCEDDPDSGDSHNYAGSLASPESAYTDIDGTVEKLNTEFGVDAPGTWRTIASYPLLAARLGAGADTLAALQHYQSSLLKYYIEHYRLQRGRPNSGYVQFMFIDLSPQSFYGLVDWWGVPKPSYSVVAQCNQPLAVLLRRDAHRVHGISIINDTHRHLGSVQVRWSVTTPDGYRSGTASVDLPGDSIVPVAELDIDPRAGVDVVLAAFGTDGSLLARNEYRDVFTHATRPDGHPARMSHELGMRLYDF